MSGDRENVNPLGEANDAVSGAGVLGGGPEQPVYLGSRNRAWFFQGYLRALLVCGRNPSAADKAAIRSNLIATDGVPPPHPPPLAAGAPRNLAAVEVGGGTAYLA